MAGSDFWQGVKDLFKKAIAAESEFDRSESERSAFDLLHRHALPCDVCKVAGGYPRVIRCSNGCLFTVYFCTPHFLQAVIEGVDCCLIDESEESMRVALAIGGKEVSH